MRPLHFNFIQLLALDTTHQEPEQLDDLQAVAAVRDGLLAHGLTRRAHALSAGGVVLVRPAIEGPGLCLLQLAKQRGARAIAVIGTPESEEIVRRLGADAVLVWRPAEVGAEMKHLTDGEGSTSCSTP